MIKAILDDNFRSAKGSPEAWKRAFFNLYEKRDRLNPFLVVQGHKIFICDSVAKVLRHEDTDLLLKQWPGQYRSDWFYTTVGEFRSKWDEENR